MSPDATPLDYFTRKADSGKPQYSLLPLSSLEGVVRVLEHGCSKYARDSWLSVPDAQTRYTDALMRHLALFLADPLGVDPDSGLPHVDHLATNAIFLTHFVHEALRLASIPSPQRGTE